MLPFSHTQSLMFQQASWQMLWTLQSEPSSNNALGRIGPISYFSKKLKPAESQYSTFDWELLAVNLSIKYSRHFVEGRTLHVLMDPNFFKYVLSPHSDQHTPNPKGMATAQQDPELLKLQSSLILKAVQLLTSDTTIVCATHPQGVLGHFVPARFHCTLFGSLHSLSPGIWDYDVRSGHDPVSSVSNPRASNTTATSLSTFATPDARFDNIHLDISSNSYTYFLTYTYPWTCWPEAIPITDITAETAQAFVSC